MRLIKLFILIEIAFLLGAPTFWAVSMSILASVCALSETWYNYWRKKI